VPRNLPLPNQPGAARHLAAMLKPLIEANDGRCFMLCTSHAMMRDLAEQFRATMTLPVLLQGETSKGQLLQQFVSAGNACWWPPAASGKESTCAATRCRW
jgi:ATP-dependent DNA helicase DinG